VEAGREPPVGTIAMLFTDIEGSTRLATALGSGWAAVLADHHELLGRAIGAHGGFIDGTEGDAFFATFVEPAAAAAAAVEALRALRAHRWPAHAGELRVRMGLHVGFVERRATGYVGLEVHRAARVAAAAHGGQLLLTGAARALVGEAVASEPLGLHRLKDFPASEALFCAVVDGRGAAYFPAPRTEEVRPTNLPAGVPALVGREAELDLVRDTLTADGERLVTLTGRGGVGKTSLALVAATALLGDHPGGVWFVALASVSSADEVPAAIASAIGAEEDALAPPVEAVVARLRHRGATLLVIDNMEHLLAAAPALGELLEGLPGLKILATSQTPLRLAGERCVQLDALDDRAALSLIARVTTRRGRAPAGDPTERAALLEIVRLLDGLPLALELAAARLGVLSAQQLRDRLVQSTDLLHDTGVARPDRQRSLRATVEWTLELLDQQPYELFVRMGAFAGPIELEELELVAGGDGLDVIEALATLLDVSLVRRVESGDARVRFGLPEALRQIAAELLDASSDGSRWRHAHAARQHELLWPARAPWGTAEVYAAAVAADTEAAAALRWARAQGDPLAAPLAAARGSLAADRGRFREGLAVLQPLIEHPSGDPEVDAIALTARAVALTIVERIDEARASASQAVGLAPDPATEAWALATLGLVEVFGGDHADAVGANERALVLARDLSAAELSGALVLTAQARIVAGDLDHAAALLTEAEQVGLPVEAKMLRHLDTLRGDLAVAAGAPDAAIAHYARSLERAEARGDDLQVMFDLWGLVGALALIGQDSEAVEVAGIAQAHSREISGPASKTLQHMLTSGAVTVASQRLGASRAAEQTERGRSIPPGARVTRACRLATATVEHRGEHDSTPAR
jgi:predicted ATPase/class 3 adenylate cyclase